MLLLAVALVLVVAVGAWRSVSGARLEAVRLAAVPGGVSCSSGSVSIQGQPFSGGIGSPEAPLPVMAAQPGMRCAVRLELVNTGDNDVRIDSVTIPHGGPASRVPVRLVSTAPTGPTKSDIDVVVSVDEVLAAGATRLITLRFEYREDGCHGPNSAMYIAPDGPFVRIEAFGRSAEVKPGAPAYGAAPFRGGSCP